MSHKQSYYSKISLKNKTPEEAEKIIQLFEQNKRIAYKIASKYYRTHYWEFDDALQIAQMGLWKACLIWDPDKYKISTLAYNVINRDFIDYDVQQKRQPDILFNLEDTCVTDDISLSEVIVDENSDVYNNYQQTEDMIELNEDIVYILDDIAEELKIHKSLVKIIYIVYLEATTAKGITLKNINFIPRQIVKTVIERLQNKLSEII